MSHCSPILCTKQKGTSMPTLNENGPLLCDITKPSTGIQQSHDWHQSQEGKESTEASPEISQGFLLLSWRILPVPCPDTLSWVGTGRECPPTDVHILTPDLVNLLCYTARDSHGCR